MSDNEAMRAPKHRFTIGRYRFGRYGKGSWEVDNGAKGTHGTGPSSAFWRLKKWEKRPDPLPPREPEA